MPGKNDPLTKEEMSSAASKFLELFKIVTEKVPEATVEDALKIMESCAKLAHKERADALKKEADERFGFVKITEETND
jgi:hypothetical protein